jgi:hypothetical protein
VARAGVAEYNAIMRIPRKTAVGLCSMLILAACSSPSPQRPTPITSGPAPDDVPLVVHYRVGPGLNGEVTPDLIAERVGASTCAAWALNPISQGGSSIEVHLHVPPHQVAAATATVNATVTNASVDTSMLSTISAAPKPYVVPSTDSGAGTVVRPPHLRC